MARIPEISVKDFPEVKEHIKKLEDALREVKELVQKGRYYKIGSVVDRALQRFCETCKSKAEYNIFDHLMTPNHDNSTWDILKTEEHCFCKEHMRDPKILYPEDYMGPGA